MGLQYRFQPGEGGRGLHWCKRYRERKGEAEGMEKVLGGWERTHHTPHHPLNKYCWRAYYILGASAECLSLRDEADPVPIGIPAQCHPQSSSWAQWLWNESLTPIRLPFFFFLSSICKLIQSKRQLLKSRYFILMWVIPIISYIKISDFSCHPTGGGDVISDLFYRCMCICFYFVYGTWEAVIKLVSHSKCGNRSSEIFNLYIRWKLCVPSAWTCVCTCVLMHECVCVCVYSQKEGRGREDDIISHPTADLL